jgi:hypothetical protein
MGREGRILGGELPSLFMEKEGFMDFLGKKWGGGGGVGEEGIGVDSEEDD